MSKWYNFAYNKEEDKNELSIYDEIGAWGITASNFLIDLRSMDNEKRLSVRINSPGGDVFDGIAIYNLLKEYEGGVDVIIDGIAASIASVIAMAGETVKIHESAMFMIHKPWTIAAGDANDMRKSAEILDKIQEQILTTYKTRAKISDEELNTLVNSETWMGGKEAVEKGFADELIKAGKKKDIAKKFDNKIISLKDCSIFSKFTNIPNRIAALIKPVNEDIEPEVEPHTEPIEQEPNSGKEPQAENNTDIEKPLTSEESMTDEEIKKQKDEAANAAIVAERNRQAEIRATAKKLNIADSVVESAVEKGLSFADAAKIFADEFARGTTPVTPNPLRVNNDEGDKFRAQNVASLCAAHGITTDRAQRDKDVHNGGAHTLHGLYRAYLARAGKNALLEGEALVREVHNLLVGVGTSDLTSILQDTMNKELDKSMQMTRTTFQRWTKSKPVKDFRQFSLTKMSSLSDLEEIKENEGFKIGALSDKKEVGTLATKGVFLPLSRQAQINDDLGALLDLTQAMGGAVMRAQNTSCYDLLFSNPTMLEDNKALFHTDHKNYVTSGGAAPSSTTVDAAVDAIMNQVRLKGNPKDKSEPTGAIPRYLICPSKHKGVAERLVYSSTYPSSLVTYVGVYNPYNAQGNNPLDVVVEPYLKALDEDQWYMATDPNEISTLVRLTLMGNEAPIIEQDRSRGAEPLGLMFRCFYDWAWMVGDWRGLYANDGD